MRFAEFVLDPSDERLIGPAGPIHIGNKAFRVLWTLVGMQGRLLTKEQLFETVWDGTVVSESVLTSAIRELRRALGDDAKEPRFIESVYGRGYRFIASVSEGEPIASARNAAVAANPAAPGSAPWSRRHVLAAGAIGAAAVAGGALWLREPAQPAVSPEVEALMERARMAMDMNTREGQNQAIGMFRRVTELAPDFADGWGRLGYAYAVPSHYRQRAENAMLRARAEEAGRRALEIDPGNALGEVALTGALPFRGAWIERDFHLARAIADRPDALDVLIVNGVLQQFTGRNAEAAASYERIRALPFTPAVITNYLRALWSAGHTLELDRAMEEAGTLYPTQASVWSTRASILKYSGRTDALSAMMRDPQTLPTGLGAAQLEDELAVTRAIETREPSAVDKVVNENLRSARLATGLAEEAIRVAGALGRVDEAFAITEAYYFERGFAVPDARGPDGGGFYSVPEQRQTRFLFEPVTRSMRADPRFGPLVAELGLDRYWRETGVVPDYRRTRGA